MERRVFRYGSEKYAYSLVVSNRKSFSLIVKPNQEIILKAPRVASEQDLDNFLKKKWVWLKKQLSIFERYKKASREKEYVAGESFYYLGRQYMLHVENSSHETIKVSPGVITIFTASRITNTSQNKKIYEKWYHGRCLNVFKKELVELSKNYGIKTIPRLKVREMSRRWGSYQKAGIVNLNPKLLQASRAAIRYVITHELCHIGHPLHDEEFFALLSSRIPDWERIKDELEVRFG